MNAADQSQPLTPAMISLLRELLDAPPGVAGAKVMPMQRCTVQALERRGFASTSPQFPDCASITLSGAAVLAAYDRIHGAV